MKGVEFIRPVVPYGAGDPALLPDDVADRVIASGEARPYTFPADPHAHEAGYQPPPLAAPEPSRRDQKLSLRKK